MDVDLLRAVATLILEDPSIVDDVIQDVRDEVRRASLSSSNGRDGGT